MAVQPENLAIWATFGTITVTVITAARVYLRRLELTHGPGAPRLDGAVEQRLERIEQAVESIAIEVERLNEGQRFTTKLLAERPAAPRAVPSSAAPRIDTPH